MGFIVSKTCCNFSGELVTRLFHFEWRVKKVEKLHLHIKMLKMVTKISWNKNWKKLWNIWKGFLHWSGDFWQLKMLAMNSERSNFLIKVFTSLNKLKWKKFLTSEVQACDFFLLNHFTSSKYFQSKTHLKMTFLTLHKSFHKTQDFHWLLF